MASPAKHNDRDKLELSVACEPTCSECPYLFGKGESAQCFVSH